jgi:hypothetical protein
MALTLISWNAVVSKKWKTSSEFKQLDTAVKAYIGNTASAQNLSTLKTKWDAWNVALGKDGKTYSTSDRYTKGCALDDIATLFKAVPKAAPGAALAAPNPQALAAQVIASQAATKFGVRENKVVVKKVERLVFTMTGPTNLSVDMELRYNFRKIGVGKQDAEILVTLPIKVHQGAAAKAYWTSQGYSADSFDKTVHGGGKPGVVGATADENVLKIWTKNINDWWGNAAVIHHPPAAVQAGQPSWVKQQSAEQNFYRLKFEFTFTDDATKACKEICCVRTTGEAALVNPSGTIDAVRWGVSDAGPGGPICHEVGHFLGCPDEYYTIAYEGRTLNWGDGYTRDTVMNNPDKKPLARHYRRMGQELARQFSFDPNQASIVLNVGLSLNNAAQQRHKLSGHIWD